MRIYNKILNDRYIDKYVYGLCDVNVDNVIKNIHILFKDIRLVLDNEDAGNDIYDYIFDCFEFTDNFENINNRLLYIRDRKIIRDNFNAINNTIIYMCVDTLKYLIDMYLEISTNGINIDVNKKHAKVIECKLLPFKKLINDKIGRINRCKPIGKTSQESRMVLHEIKNYLKNNYSNYINTDNHKSKVSLSKKIWEHFANYTSHNQLHTDDGYEIYMDNDVIIEEYKNKTKKIGRRTFANYVTKAKKEVIEEQNFLVS
ncbi:hypothetical protein KI811_18245 [Geobacter hydrogenophilus]|uniref:Uncharacterized protein n=1 Tax=Geobacter hydrogenophilus TaxID=40983 RepID=A0A9W6G375_9BACT|nr:hypothetical protein [Geobacter hydrogenophilus]MBT0895749.1 hypothetical protein [Geobacter hydrogenophilus]GLI39473.1 hypothetical protein GHYDROH2_29740 [Geobacter hydrogenophilus]